MKIGTLFFIASLLLFFTYSCTEDLWDSDIPERSFVDSSLKKKEKCDVCHYQEDTDTWKKLSLGCGKPIEVHIRHGDGLPGQEVPGNPDFIFGEECELIENNVECPCFTKEDVLDLFSSARLCDTEEILCLYDAGRRGGPAMALQINGSLNSCYIGQGSLSGEPTTIKEEKACRQVLEEAITSLTIYPPDACEAVMVELDRYLGL